MPKFVESKVYLNRKVASQAPYLVAIIFGRPQSGEWLFKEGDFQENVGAKNLTKKELKDIKAFLDILDTLFTSKETSLYNKELVHDLSAHYASQFGLHATDTEAPFGFTFSEPKSIIASSVEVAFNKLLVEKEIKVESTETLDSLEVQGKEETVQLDEVSLEKDPHSEGERDPSLEDMELGAEYTDNVRQLFGRKGNQEDLLETPFDSTYPDVYPPELSKKQELMKELAKTTFQFAILLDKAMENIAEPFLNKLYEENERRAQENPLYRDIQARRHVNGHHILFSEEAGLGMEEVKIENDILNKVRSHPWWEKPLRAISMSPLNQALSKGKWLYQRATRSWDDTELWSLDTVFTKRLGEQLMTLAQDGHGWPGEDNGYSTKEEWEEALYSHGNALRYYSLKKINFSFYTTAEGEERYAKLYSDAKDALSWVAENLELLWD